MERKRRIQRFSHRAHGQVPPGYIHTPAVAARRRNGRPGLRGRDADVKIRSGYRRRGAMSHALNYILHTAVSRIGDNGKRLGSQYAFCPFNHRRDLVMVCPCMVTSNSTTSLFLASTAVCTL
ncbi:MAG: hypothetical protein LBB68_09300 [Treponema sp.]|nr:hypothetical protein [Treponema sp.]